MTDLSALQPEAPGQLAELAHRLADLSASAILPHFRSGLAVENKGSEQRFDPVTAADRAGEEVIRAELSRLLPDHGVLGEEMGERKSDSRYRWVIDPIDGTRAFILGLPTWGTLIGLEREGSPFIGLMNQPFTQERFWSDGDRSYFAKSAGSPQRLSTRNDTPLDQAFIASTSPDLFTVERERAAFARLQAATRDARYGADCYAYCLVAAGFVDVVVESGLQPYDIVALIPIIENAGGCVTTWDGHPANSGGRIVATSGPRLHEQVLELLQDAL